MDFDLLSTVEYGGCSAKVPAKELAQALSGLPKVEHENLLVDIDTHDDAGVYKLTDDIALVLTTDFFPPICSNPYEFGQIAAANALSDVFAMGGLPNTALNLVMFPAKRIPLQILERILHGGQDKVAEAGAIIVGGHTIDDYPPKYGLAVTGTVHPDKIITNANAKVGDALILTKPIGTGAIVAGQRIGEARPDDYQRALDTMKQLNRSGAEVMIAHRVRAATDITGFGLLGHALKMAQGGGVTIVIDSDKVPALPGAYELLDMGCIPGAAFRNLDFIEAETEFAGGLDYSLKMLLLDAQTSGGLFMCAPAEEAEDMVDELRSRDCPFASIIGQVAEAGDKALVIR